VRRVGIVLFAPLVSLALLAAAGEEALGHRHAFSEEDLAAHSLVVVDHEGAYDTDTHYDRAVDSHHDACPACALSASPSGPPPSLAVLSRPLELDARIPTRQGPALLERGPGDAPARAPPSAA
jgi:hypothetical protein